MCDDPSPDKRAEWARRAAVKNAIVPRFFEVFVNRVILECGHCGGSFQRPLVPNVNEPTFVCPNKDCRAKNWVPVHFKRGAS